MKKIMISLISRFAETVSESRFKIQLDVSKCQTIYFFKARIFFLVLSRSYFYKCS